MGTNLFLDNMQDKEKGELISLRKNEEFAYQILHQMQQAYDVKSQSKRREEQIEIEIEPHTYGENSAGFLVVEPDKVRFMSSIWYPSLAFVLDKKFDYNKERNKLWGAHMGDEYIDPLNKKINALAKKLHFTTEIRRNCSSGDTIKFTTTLSPSDPHLNDKIKVIMRIFKSKSVKVNLGAL